MSVSTELKSLGHSISFHSGISAAMARRQECARILMYHGIAEGGGHALESQVRYLTRNFKVVSLEAMVNRLSTNRATGDNEIVLTFDDGLRNNVTIVYPILRAFQIPATFFVCPALIGSGKWLWNHEARCRLRSLDPGNLANLRSALLIADISVDGIIEWMKTLPPPQRQQAEEHIRLATPGFRPSVAERQDYDIMDWDELLSLDPGLVNIGSHTLTHPILTTLAQDQIDFELRESRRLLEQKLARTVDFFCYPNGSLDAGVQQAVRNNYRAAVTTETGVLNGKSELNLHRLPRIPSAETAALTAWRLHRPEA